MRARLEALQARPFRLEAVANGIAVEIGDGAKNKQRALSVVGQTANLLIRPVLEELPATAGEQGQSGALTTPAGEDNPEMEVILPEKNASGAVTKRYRLGPSLVNGQRTIGAAMSSARATQDPSGTWVVDVTLSPEGSRLFDQFAQSVGIGKQVAFDLDGVVLSAPTFTTTNFSGRVRITAAFTEAQADNLALVLPLGPLPTQLMPQTVATFERHSWGPSRGQRNVGAKGAALGVKAPAGAASEPFSSLSATIHDALIRLGISDHELDRSGEGMVVVRVFEALDPTMQDQVSNTLGVALAVPPSQVSVSLFEIV